MSVYDCENGVEMWVNYRHKFQKITQEMEQSQNKEYKVAGNIFM
jgi:hypothetical protein